MDASSSLSLKPQLSQTQFSNLIILDVWKIEKNLFLPKAQNHRTKYHQYQIHKIYSWKGNRCDTSRNFYTMKILLGCFTYKENKQSVFEHM